MSEAVIARAEVLVYEARLYCDAAALLRDATRANRVDSLILKVRAQEVRGARRIHGASSSAPAQDRGIDGDPLCRVCDKGICPDDSTGGVDGKLAHLACWVKTREEGRRAPPQLKS